jgi:hypothetical protein
VERKISGSRLASLLRVGPMRDAGQESVDLPTDSLPTHETRLHAHRAVSSDGCRDAQRLLKAMPDAGQRSRS